jgi:hypothetical protein
MLAYALKLWTFAAGFLVGLVARNLIEWACVRPKQTVHELQRFVQRYTEEDGADDAPPPQQSDAAIVSRWRDGDRAGILIDTTKTSKTKEPIHE